MEKYTIIRKDYIQKDVVVVEIEPTKEFKAGSFMTFMLEKPRAYSISSCPSENKLMFCIKINSGGVGGDYFDTVEVGATVNANGPFPHLKYEGEDKCIFIATGTGVTPVRSIIKEYYSEGKDFTLLLGSKDKLHLYFNEEFEELTKKGLKYIPILSRENWDGAQGHVQDHIPIDPEATYFLCGKPEMVSEMKKLLEEKGITKIKK